MIAALRLVLFEDEVFKTSEFCRFIFRIRRRVCRKEVCLQNGRHDKSYRNVRSKLFKDAAQIGWNAFYSSDLHPIKSGGSLVGIRNRLQSSNVNRRGLSAARRRPGRI